MKIGFLSTMLEQRMYSLTVSINGDANLLINSTKKGESLNRSNLYSIFLGDVF